MPQINSFFRTYGPEAVMFWCPGCKSVHAVWIRGPHAWGFNCDYEKPTFTPSILVTGGAPHEDGREKRCHTFITDGVIDFLGDCTHELAGQKHPLEPLPPQWRAEADPVDA